jgi:hypothetical protein
MSCEAAAWHSFNCSPRLNTDKAGIEIIAPKIHIARQDDARGRCNDSNRLNKLRISFPLTRSSTVTSIPVDT